MGFDIIRFITDPFVLLFITAIAGILIGKIRIKDFELGASGGMFAGLLMGWLIYHSFAVPYIDAAKMPDYAANMIGNGIVPKLFFDGSLIVFVASAGILASRDIKHIIRNYGIRFILLGFFITFVGALCTFFAASLYPAGSFTIAGLYTGALTSSPGLAAAIEAVATFGNAAEAGVGYGYAIGYAPGVLVVILAMRMLPLIFRIDVHGEAQAYQKEIYESTIRLQKQDVYEGFDILGFALVCLTGYFLGSVELYLGAAIGSVKLGSSGGVLLAALILGNIRKLGVIYFVGDIKIYNALKELSLTIFLSTVGLRYGYDALSALSGSGAILAGISFLIGAAAIIAGFILGRYVFKFNWILLAGAICGGMTSTPGLGAAIDGTHSDDVASGYGATYPFALMGMVVFTIALIKFI